MSVPTQIRKFEGSTELPSYQAARLSGYGLSEGRACIRNQRLKSRNGANEMRSQALVLIFVGEREFLRLRPSSAFGTRSSRLTISKAGLLLQWETRTRQKRGACQRSETARRR